VVFILDKTKLALTLLIAVIVAVCAVYVSREKVVKTTVVVDPTIEYGITAGVCSSIPKLTAIEPIVEEQEVILVEEPAPQWVELEVPSNNSFKSYMDCSAITDVNSAQYRFKYEYLSSACGIMLVDDRYVCAVGSYYATEIGTRIDLVMENGSIVPCVVGDIKADKHTDKTNRQHSKDNSVVEFIVATDNLSNEVTLHGDCSYADERLKGEIKSIRVYINN
jgi:hypothetical protein